MKRFYPLLSGMLLMLSANAQDYFPVNRNGSNYYTGDGKTISAYVADSSENNGAVTYILNRNIQKKGPWDCYATNNSSWLGHSFSNYGDTLYEFNNLFRQPVKLYLNMQLGENRIAFSDTNVTVMFEYKRDEPIMIGAEQDSIKVFRIVVLDKQLQPLSSNIFHNKEIHLSRNHGFTRVVSFYYFPLNYNTSDYPYLSYIFELSGNSRTSGGIKNIIAQDMFDFEIGDEFHHLEFTNSSSLFPITYEIDSSWIILKVIDKGSSVNSRVYNLKRRKATYNIKRDTLTGDLNYSTTIIEDTITQAYIFSSYPSLNQQPEISHNTPSKAITSVWKTAWLLKPHFSPTYIERNRTRV